MLNDRTEVIQVVFLLYIHWAATIYSEFTI